MKILIAEDDFLSRKLLNAFFSSLGQVDIATNGKEAIEAVSLAYHENEPYEVICLDIMMPLVDGISALRKIRFIEVQYGLSKETWSKIIMTTALSNKDNVIAAGQAHCDAYLIKPITKTRLFEILRSLGFNLPEK